MSLDDEARAELAQLENAHLRREPRVVDGAPGPEITIDGLRVANFAANDYLSLAGDARIARSAMNALEEAGVGAGASRLITGNHREHVRLEAALGDWLRCDGVRVFTSGYAANVGLVSTLARAGDVVFSDELNHASLIDGCRLSRAEIVVVPHRDLVALERGLATVTGRRRIVLTETLFSMDGDVADVRALSELCRRFDAALVVDEAHALGVLGPEGRGVAAEAGVVPDALIATCGKALGSHGAFVATTRAVADLLWNRARSLVFSTGSPPAVAAATRAAIEIVRSSDGDERRATLAAKARWLRSRVRVGGAVGSPIAPLVVGDDRRVMEASGELLRGGVFVQGIRPPTVPVGTARLRVSLQSGHTASQVEALADLLGDAVRRFT